MQFYFLIGMALAGLTVSALSQFDPVLRFVAAVLGVAS